MTSRAEIEKLLRDAYDARVRGDVDGICRVFAPQPRFQMAGSNASRIAVRIDAIEPFRQQMRQMIDTFQMRDHKVLTILVDGNKAAVHWRVTIYSPHSKETVETDLFDLVEIENGRISSFLEFCDTAMAARMMPAK